MRLALATMASLPEGPPDEAGLIAALAGEGVAAQWCPWDLAGTEWGSFDAVLLRAPWNYPSQLAPFEAWLDQVSQAGCALLNPLPVLRWNLDKRYLLALEAAGVKGVPTRFLESPLPSLAATMAETGWGEAVLKPAVSASGLDTWRLSHPEANRHQGAAEVLAQERGALMLQPFLPGILAEGEWSLMSFFDPLAPGRLRFSHAVLKRPLAGEFRVQEHHGGQSVAVEAPIALQAAAQKVLLAAQGCVAQAQGAEPEPQEAWAYARVDGLWDGQDFTLMELEAVEPSLYLNHAPASTQAFAKAIALRLQGLRPNQAYEA